MAFDAWASSPDGYCHSCEELNATIEIPSVEEFHTGVDIGDAYSLTSPKFPCFLYEDPPGTGCRYELHETFDCVPQSCLDVCVGSCPDGCTDDEGCSPERCSAYVCGTDEGCYFYGGGMCGAHCVQSMACVFDEEHDPDHTSGSCAPAGDCVASVEPNTCSPIQLRIRATFYMTVDRKAAVSIVVILFSRTITGIAVATILYGFHEFEDDELDCDEFDYDLPLFPIAGYTQPPTPACGAPTSVRITGLP
ncbi:MAG: hypothetical protein K8U03_06620 [Planctomycetia bacterium]|nr:hypothetical protein [Planctomycetia bacterium]